MIFLFAALGYRLFPAIAMASGIAEIPLMLWLLVVGLDARRWTERARAAEASR